MQRRLSQRARTDFGVRAQDGSLVAPCRGIDVSPTGILLDRGHRVGERDVRVFTRLELRLPERCRPVRAVARPVWAFGNQQAFKFVAISDVDRLTLAEHVDLMRKRGRVPT